MIDPRFFKNAKIAERANFLHPTATMLLEEMMDWCLKRAISPVVTETVTTPERSRVSTTHCEGRVFDIRTAGWASKDVEEFQKYFGEKYGHWGALSSTRKPALIVHHDAGTGLHFHVQLGRGFAVLKMPTSFEKSS